MALFGLVVGGIDRLKGVLLSLAPLIRRKYGRKALRKGAAIVRDRAKLATPVLARNIYRRGVLIRKPGTVRDAITVRRSKDAERNGDVGVFVNVKPAKGSDRGRYSPADSYYWRWIHFATKRNKNPIPFLSIGGRDLTGDPLKAIETSLAADINKLNNGAP